MGVLGGIGPMVVHYLRHAPILLTDEGKPLRLDPRLLKAARRLGSLADFLVITSNGIHLFQSEIEQAAGCRVLSMVEATLKEVQRTEIPFLIAEADDDPSLINPVQLLAEAAVKVASMDTAWTS
jgi:aspartate/glutamate racemase